MSLLLITEDLCRFFFDLILILKSKWVHRIINTGNAEVIKDLSAIRIMVAVVIDRTETSNEERSTFENLRDLFVQ